MKNKSLNGTLEEKLRLIVYKNCPYAGSPLEKDCNDCGDVVSQLISLLRPEMEKVIGEDENYEENSYSGIDKLLGGRMEASYNGRNELRSKQRKRLSDLFGEGGK